MIWLKSTSMGLAAVVLGVVAIAILPAVLILARQGGMVALRPLVVVRLLSTWLVLSGAFLLGFGWELRRLGH